MKWNLSNQVMRKLTLTIIIVFILTSLNIFPASSPPSPPEPIRPLPPTLCSVKYNAPSELALDIVFIPVNFSLDELDQFRQKVDSYSNLLLSLEPFSEYKDRINIWRVDTTVDIPFYRWPGIPRCLVVDYGKAEEIVRSVIDLELTGEPPNDQIIALVNTRTYGGSGGNTDRTCAQVSVAYTGTMGVWVLMHEFGHAFGDLGEEFVIFDADYPAGKDIPWPNVDWDGSKWADVPGTGAYLGAEYRNLVRPTDKDCIMNKLEAQRFCPVCQRAFANVLNHFPPPYARLHAYNLF